MNRALAMTEFIWGRAYKAASSTPKGKSKDAKRSLYERNEAVKQYVLALKQTGYAKAVSAHLEPHHTGLFSGTNCSRKILEFLMVTL